MHSLKSVANLPAPFGRPAARLHVALRVERFVFGANIVEMLVYELRVAAYH